MIEPRRYDAGRHRGCPRTGSVVPPTRESDDADVGRALRPHTEAMGELAILAVAGTGTALATGLGAIPVFALGGRADALRPLLWGLAAGVMAVASVVGLLEPALDEGSGLAVAAGLLAGVLFLVAGRRALERRDFHIGELHGAGVRRSVLVFGVLLVHSLPEGFAIGTPFASKQAGLGVFVLLAIALQNVPEGTTSAIPMRDAGFSPALQFWAAVATSAPQPVGAVMAYLLVEEFERCFPCHSRSRPARCSRS